MMYTIKAINTDKITPDEYFELAFSEKSIVKKVRTFREVCEYLGGTPKRGYGGYSCSKGDYDYIITKE